jgi:hypothetical protein
MPNKPQIAVLVVPAFLLVWYKKKFHRCYVNMNNYRNWHGVLSNNAKKEFYKQTKKQIEALPKMSYINSIEYTLIVPTLVSRDRMNVYSVVDKFFCDALQKFGIIEDDKDEMIGGFYFTKKRYQQGKSEQIRVRIEMNYNKK